MGDLVRYAEQFVAQDAPRFCVLTGTEANIRLVHRGEEFYFCCLMCQEAFLKNPRAAIAERKDRR